MSTKTSECWTTDPNARAIRVEASHDRTLLLPFDQFIYSELTVTDTGQHLRIIFASHDVSVAGTGLRRIETALQRMELASLSVTTNRPTASPSPGDTAIREILIIESRSAETEPFADTQPSAPSS